MAYTTLTSLFTAIAQAIRNKKGGSGSINAQDFPSEIASIVTGETPTISVSSAGVVTARSGAYTSTHTLSSSDDSDFVAANIRSGKTVFGVSGSLDAGYYLIQITGFEVSSGSILLTLESALPSGASIKHISCCGLCNTSNAGRRVFVVANKLSSYIPVYWSTVSAYAVSPNDSISLSSDRAHLVITKNNDTVTEVSEFSAYRANYVIYSV